MIKITHKDNPHLMNWDYERAHDFNPSDRVLPIAGLLKYPKYSWKEATWETAPEYVHEKITGSVLKTGNGIIVIDFDVKPEGNGMKQFLKYFEDSPEMIAEMRKSALTHTPSGGTHSYFTLPENVKIKSIAGIHEKMPHVDTRAEGGLIVLPGSQVPNKIEGLTPERYVSNHGAIQPIPEKLLKFLIEECGLEYTEKKPKVSKVSTDHNVRKVSSVSMSSSEKEVNSIEAYINSAIEAQKNELMGASARNDQLNNSAYSLARILTESEVFEALESTALSIGLEPEEVDATIRSAVNAQHEFITLIEKNKKEEVKAEEDYPKNKEVKDMKIYSDELFELDDILNFDIDEDIMNNNKKMETVRTEEAVHEVLAMDSVDDSVHDQLLDEELDEVIVISEDSEDEGSDDVMIVEKKGLTEKAAREKILRDNGLDNLSLARFWEEKAKESGYLKMAETGELYRVNECNIYGKDSLYERWAKETKKELISKIEKVAAKNNIFLDDVLVKIERNTFLKDAYSAGKVDVFSIEEAFNKEDAFVDSQGVVVSLKNGKVRKATPEDLVLNHANAQYVGRYNELEALGYSKEKETLEELLTALTPETREYFQAVAGSGLSSKPPHEGKIYFNYSSGGSGKTTIMNFISETLGYYGENADSSILSFDAHEEYLADLRGSRLAYIEEAPGSMIDVSQLKKMVDSSSLKTRKMFQSTENTPITWTFFVNTNNLPRVQQHEVNDALQRRVVIIPWTKKYSGTPQDKTYFKELYKNERMRSVMLSWLVDGAIVWFSDEKIEGNLPEEVKETTQSWFEAAKSNNPISAFVAEMLELDDDYYIITEEIFAVFQEYCKRANFKYAKSRLAFSKELVNHIDGLELGSVRPAGRAWSTLSGAKSIDPQNRANKILNLKFTL